MIGTCTGIPEYDEPACAMEWETWDGNLQDYSILYGLD